VRKGADIMHTVIDHSPFHCHVATLQKDPLMASMPGTPAATLNRQLTSAVSKFAANSSPSQTIGSVTRVIRT
jgi:hypothetical protein